MILHQLWLPRELAGPADVGMAAAIGVVGLGGSDVNPVFDGWKEGTMSISVLIGNFARAILNPWRGALIRTLMACTGMVALSHGIPMTAMASAQVLLGLVLLVAWEVDGSTRQKS